MKYLLMLYFLFLNLSIAFAQDDANYRWVDTKILQIPIAETYSTTAIATYVQLNFSKKEDKLRAIYKWITANIKYNKDSMYFSNWGGNPEVKMASILRKRKGVCDNYAALFTNIATKCGIASVVVSGYTKISGLVNMAGHSWCAVQVEKEWLLCDPTWDAGFTIAANWFLKLPEDFIETHMPFDPLFQLLSFPLTHTQFRKGITSEKYTKKVYHYADSVNAFLKLDTLQQLEAATNRMLQTSFDNNEQLKTWYDYNKMKIAIVYEERNMEWYNEGAKALNTAKKLFNNFVQYRNNNFTPVRTLKEVNVLFASIEKYIDSAQSIIKKIGTQAADYQYNTDEINDSLYKLSARLKEEKKSFLANTQQSKQAKK